MRGRKGLLGGFAAAAVASAVLAPAAFGAGATVTVNTPVDEYDLVSNGDCSLREAIKSVDGVDSMAASGADFGGCVATGTYSASVSDPDTILVPAGTYELTIDDPTATDDVDVSGDLDIFRSVTIKGTGNPTIRQTTAERVVDIPATGKQVELDGLTVTGGDRPTASGGGGIRSDGAGNSSFKLDHVTLTGNSIDAGSIAAGGGLWSSGDTEIADSVISDNKVADGGTGFGGGIYYEGEGRLLVTNSRITGNHAAIGGTNGSGGGIYRYRPSLPPPIGPDKIEDTELSDNVAHDFGGGLYVVSDGETTVENSLLAGNKAQLESGGGLFAASHNHAAGTLNFFGSTATGNESPLSGGGLQFGGAGVASTNAVLLFATLAQNTAPSGSEWSFTGNAAAPPAPEALLMASIIDPSPGSPSPCSLAGPPFGTVNDSGRNLTSVDPMTHDCGVLSFPAGNHLNLPFPIVEPLADNGGPTKTMALPAGSVGINNFLSTQCQLSAGAITTDQRGYPRRSAADPNCDSGAYEAFICDGVPYNGPGPVVSACPAPPVCPNFSGCAVTGDPFPAKPKCRKGRKLKKVKKKFKCVKKKKNRKK